MKKADTEYNGGNIMKKKFEVQGLDCAMCAAKLEAAVKKLPGVLSASVNFLTERLVLEADETAMPGIVSALPETAKNALPKVTLKEI